MRRCTARGGLVTGMPMRARAGESAAARLSASRMSLRLPFNAALNDFPRRSADIVSECDLSSRRRQAACRTVCAVAGRLMSARAGPATRLGPLEEAGSGAVAILPVPSNATASPAVRWSAPSSAGTSAAHRCARRAARHRGRCRSTTTAIADTAGLCAGDRAAMPVPSRGARRSSRRGHAPRASHFGKTRTAPAPPSRFASPAP